jgi:hypothetical protein
MKLIHFLTVCAIAAVAFVALRSGLHKVPEMPKPTPITHMKPIPGTPQPATDLYAPQIAESNDILRPDQGTLFTLHPVQFENRSDY